MEGEADEKQPMLAQVAENNVDVVTEPEESGEQSVKPELASGRPSVESPATDGDNQSVDTKPEQTTDLDEESVNHNLAGEGPPDVASDDRLDTQSVNDGDISLRVGSPSADGAHDNVRASSMTLPNKPTTPGDKPVKPPRSRSMRSKDSPPQIRLEDEKKDLEAAKLGPTGDAIDANPTDAVAPVKQDAVQPKKKFGLDYVLGNKKIVLGIIAVVLVILIILIVGVSVSRKDAPVPAAPVVYADPTVYGLQCGGAKGKWELDHEVAVFKGIPYSQAPVGNNRWAYDLDITSCDGQELLDASQFKDACFQTNYEQRTNDTYIGSEDCLHLNVYSPNLKTDSTLKEELLPVLVYIHGGCLHWGAGNEEVFSPRAEVAKEMGVVVVSLNYRLNVFGWLAVQDLVDGKVTSGNFGLADQIRALKWVKSYIKSFGGNPELITVAGTSSGGTSILALLSSKKADGLFQRAWISGASSKFDGDKADTIATNERTYLRNVGCPKGAGVRDCLLNKTSAELIDAVPWIQYPSWDPMDIVRPPTKDRFIGGVLINDGVYVPSPPIDHLISQPNISVPLLIGNGEYETNRYQEEPIDKWTWGQYADYVRDRMDTFGEDKSDFALTQYAQHLKTNPRLHMAKFVSDMRSMCPQTFISDVLKDKTSIYRYVLTAGTPKALSDRYLGGSIEATHGTDFLMLFHYSEDDSKEFKEAKERFRRIIKNYMVEGHIQDWSPFPTVYNVSATDVSESTEWTVSSCEQWREYYPSYSWMN